MFPPDQGRQLGRGQVLQRVLILALQLSPAREGMGWRRHLEVAALVWLLTGLGPHARAVGAAVTFLSALAYF